MAENDAERCNDCFIRSAGVVQRVDKLEQRVDYVERDMARSMQEVKEHMRNEDSSFEKIFSEIRQLRDQITGIVTTALRDRNDMEKEFEVRFHRQEESNRQRFVTKNEVRVGWGVAVAVLSGAIWFFTYMQDTSTKAQFERLTDRIVKELKK